MSCSGRVSPTTPVVTAAAVEPWPLLASLPSVASVLAPTDRVLVVAAHPDDETIGAGRLIADHPGPSTALTLSRGEHCLPGAPTRAMGERRMAEWREAMGALGVATEEGLGRWPDGALEDHEPEIGRALAGVLGSYDVVLTTWRHDPHPDHRAAGRACAAASAALDGRVRVVEFPVWAPYWTPIEEVSASAYEMCVVDTTAQAAARRQAALTAYASQTSPPGPGAEPVVPPTMLARHHAQLLAVPQ